MVVHLEGSGFQVISAKRFPIRYKARFVNSQIVMCAPRLAKFADRSLASALTASGEALRARALDHISREGSLPHGHDYVLAAEPIWTNGSDSEATYSYFLSWSDYSWGNP